MNTAHKALFALVAAVAGLALFVSISALGQSDKVGSFYEAYPIHFGGGMRTGVNPTTQAPAQLKSKELFGTCNIRVYTLPFVATSTQRVDCPATGVRSGDVCSVQLPLNTRLDAAFLGWRVDSAVGSTTNDYISLNMTNQNGVSTSSFSNSTSSAMYVCRTIAS